MRVWGRSCPARAPSASRVSDWQGVAATRDAAAPTQDLPPLMGWGGNQTERHAMTADTTGWHNATITRTGDNLAITSWLMLEQLALRVGQDVWDAALEATLATTAGFDANADLVMCAAVES